MRTREKQAHGESPHETEACSSSTHPPNVRKITANPLKGGQSKNKKVAVFIGETAATEETTLSTPSSSSYVTAANKSVQQHQLRLCTTHARLSRGKANTYDKTSPLYPWSGPFTYGDGN